MYNIAIIGPPRSGTSIVANLIYSAGFSSSPNEKAKFFGAGRVLDFFVKYGGLDLQSEKIILVDNFLSNGTDSLYGKKLIPFDKLDPSIVETWIVFSNTSSETITNLITSKSKSPMYNAIDLIK